MEYFPFYQELYYRLPYFILSSALIFQISLRISTKQFLNPFTIIYGHGGVRIGDGVRIAAHTIIIPANHNPANSEPLYESGTNAQGIEIGPNVWVGSGVRILDGLATGREARTGPSYETISC